MGATAAFDHHAPEIEPRQGGRNRADVEPAIGGLRQCDEIGDRIEGTAAGSRAAARCQDHRAHCVSEPQPRRVGAQAGIVTRRDAARGPGPVAGGCRVAAGRAATSRRRSRWHRGRLASDARGPAPPHR